MTLKEAQQARAFIDSNFPADGYLFAFHDDNPKHMALIAFNHSSHETTVMWNMSAARAYVRHQSSLTT